MGSMLILANLLSDGCLDKGWDQKDLAAALGVSRSYVNDLWHCRRDPSPQIIEKIAAVFDTHPGFVYAYARKIPPDLQGDDAFVEAFGRLLVKALDGEDLS